jgi:hypothetical protein
VRRRPLLCLALLAAPAAPASADARTCALLRGERVVAEGPRAIVTIREVHDPEADITERVRACLRSTGRSTHVTTTGSVEGDGSAFSTAIFAGRFAAVVTEYGNRYGDGGWSATVADLRARRVVTRRADLTGTREASDVPAEVVLGTRGHLAVLTRYFAQSRLVAWAGERAITVVGAAPLDGLSGLAFAGTRLTWTQEGAPRARTLPPLRR